MPRPRDMAHIETPDEQSDRLAARLERIMAHQSNAQPRMIRSPGHRSSTPIRDRIRGDGWEEGGTFFG